MEKITNVWYCSIVDIATQVIEIFLLTYDSI